MWNPSTPSTQHLEPGKVKPMECNICLKNEAKYTCPRCNIGYCSVTCYQDERHTGCSEQFYKDCVVTKLQDMTTSEEDKQRVLEMLTKDLEDKADDEDLNSPEDGLSLSERLQGLDLDTESSAVWGQLSANEKEEFARMLQDGRLAKLIELWTPWWRCQKNMSLVHEAGGQHGTSNSSAVPDILPAIPDINVLLKNSRPSSDCRFDLVNILFAYAFVARVHNGDHLECPVDSSQLLLDASHVLGKSSRCGSVGEAIETAREAVQALHSDTHQFTNQFVLTVLEDVIVLISGPGSQGKSLGFMTAALSDVASLLRRSLGVIRKELKEKGDGRECLQVLKSRVFKGEKKVVFLLSWLQRFGMSMHQATPLLQLELDRRRGDLEEVEVLKEQVNEKMDLLRPSSSSQSANQEQDSPKIVEL